MGIFVGTFQLDNGLGEFFRSTASRALTLANKIALRSFDGASHRRFVDYEHRSALPEMDACWGAPEGPRKVTNSTCSSPLSRTMRQGGGRPSAREASIRATRYRLQGRRAAAARTSIGRRWRPCWLAARRGSGDPPSGRSRARGFAGLASSADPAGGELAVPSSSRPGDGSDILNACSDAKVINALGRANSGETAQIGPDRHIENACRVRDVTPLRNLLFLWFDARAEWRHACRCSAPAERRDPPLLTTGLGLATTHRAAARQPTVFPPSPPARGARRA